MLPMAPDSALMTFWCIISLAMFPLDLELPGHEGHLGVEVSFGDAGHRLHVG